MCSTGRRLAAGTYTGVNYLTGYEQSVQAASEDKVELLKSEKKSDDSKDDSKDESTAKGSLDVSDIVEAAMQVSFPLQLNL